jgi:outer membrane immunogenic protein
MGRKLAICLLCLGAAASHSIAAAEQPNPFDGAYVGAAVGWDRIASNGRYTLNENGVDVFSFEFDRAGNGVQGQLFAGFGRTWGPFYASGELGVGLSSATVNIHNGFFAAGDFYDLSIKIRQRWSITPSVRAGYLLQPDLLAFVRFGWAFAHTRISYTSSEISTSGNELFSGQTSRWLNGPRVGAGLEYALLPNLRLRADWSFTWYSRISVVGTAAPPADVDVNSATSRPRQSLLLFGLIYSFGL